MAELRALVAKRGQLKAQLTRFGSFIEKITVEKHNELEIRLETTKNALHEFNELQDAIELADENELYSGERELFENKYFGLVADAKSVLKAYVTTNMVSGGAGNGLATASAAASYAQSDLYSQKSVRLPTLDLPKFYGNYDEWIHFHDTFNALVNNDPRLDEVNKFYYLFSCLKGDAAKVVQSLEITKENYKIAWELLRERFENKPVIVKTHVKGLFELPAMGKESHANLRRLVDAYERHARSLKVLGEPVEAWSTLLVHIVFRKLDETTKVKWEEYAGQNFSNAVPNIKAMINFLIKRCSILETVDTNIKSNRQNFDRKNERIIANVVTERQRCNFCKNDGHFIYACEKFKALAQNKRLEEVKKLKLCMNCLRTDHYAYDCKSLSTCKRCSQRHNTLLHWEKQRKTSDVAEERVTTAHTIKPTETNMVLLATARIHIRDAAGGWHEARALLDSGSQSNFMTQDLLKKLHLNTYNLSLPVSGINQCNIRIKQGTNTNIKSIYNFYATNLPFLIVNEITDRLPNFSINAKTLEIPTHVRLADPKYYESSEINILLGAGIFSDLLSIGQVKLGQGQPILQKTTLGWIISGPMTTKQNVIHCNLLVSSNQIDERLEQFWKLEDTTSTSKRFTTEDETCENIYRETTTRDGTGRFSVRLLTKENVTELGASFETAKKRFLNLERKLHQNQELLKEYSEFMNEYERLGHMTKVQEDNADMVYYLPHHAVFKEASTTTKLRVVFDASAKTTTGISLNDTLMVGPTIQQDLFSILCRFREHNYVLTGDIAKMYRQVNVIPKQRDLQRVLWRTNPNKELEYFRLNTVTYGTACAAFLAIRSLHQVAIENKETQPNIARIILDDFYVDDLITGTKTVDEALKVKNDITKILGKYGFELRKWSSNSPKITQHNHESQTKYISDDKQVKTLGILWCAQEDLLRYSIKPLTMYMQITKRTILSIIAQIFDPLGIISPTTIKAKIILQRLWQLGISWDESVPTDLHTAFKALYQGLQHLSNLKIDRHVLLPLFEDIQIHGFCDASEVAYGACIYIRTEERNNVKISLLCAKSKVAPLRKITLPRLELSGALLLAQLLKRVEEALTGKIDKVHLWSDSTIALSWIQSESCRWQTFVANRVAQIQEITKPIQWRHVSSSDNPADLISRGVEATQLMKSELWWEGPTWLKNNHSTWPKREIRLHTELPEAKKSRLLFFSTHKWEIFSRYSSLHRLKIVVAYCIRFHNNLKCKRENRKTSKLTIEELDHAFLLLIELMQHQEFEIEMKNIAKGKLIPSTSKLLCLNPILENGLLRVGGRLHHSAYSHDVKHPIILAKSHPLTQLIVREEHLRNLHIGPQGLLAILRQRYWPVNGLNLIKNILRKCTVCFKTKPVTVDCRMGDLPCDRVSVNRPFYVTGIDFCGPFNIKDGKLRNRAVVKTYVCLFVCFATKAVHMEVASDLSTEAFLNTFKRFVARRGLCKRVYTDNATNFVGAKNYFKELDSFCFKNSIEWHFSPPRSPHFGGLWESAIKSAKTHFLRVVGNNILTFEELTTVFVQIEAVLNSRPLTPLSNHPDDFLALTPGHFLIGEPLTAVPQEDVYELHSNRLTKYKTLQQLYQHFWRRWSKEYINTLQQRTKWFQQADKNIKVGDLVLLKEENTAPLQWRLGRVLQIHSGHDNIPRVVTVKTAKGEFKRAANRVCVLPVVDENFERDI